MRTRGRIWAGTLLLAVMSQFAGPLAGAASAFVGPVWLPVSQEQPEAEQSEPGSGAAAEEAPSEEAPAPGAGTEPAPSEAAEEPGSAGLAAADEGCDDAGAQTDVTTCVTDFVVCAQGDTAPADCAGAAAKGVQEEVAQLVPSEEPGCEGAEQLGCVLEQVRELACPEEGEGPQCTAIDLVANCLDADNCGAAEVIAPAAEGVCDALGAEPEPAEGEEAEPPCAERLQTCEDPDSAECAEALDYLAQRLEQTVCESDPVDCGPVEQLRDLLACEDKAACAFLALWDEATPVVCGTVAPDDQNCEQVLDGCDMPGTPGCQAAADYLAEQLEKTACAGRDAACAVRGAVESCAAKPDPGGCDSALYTAVTNVVCAADMPGDDCPPPPVPGLRLCMKWTGTEAQPTARCARDAVINAACGAQTECVLKKGPVADLIAAGDDCTGTGATPSVDAAVCAEGLRQVALGALCAQPTTCIDGLAKCSSADTTCQALAVWDEVCATDFTSCPPELKALRVCIGAAATCATQAFLQKWIADACVRSASATSACPVDVLVQPPTTVSTPDGQTVAVSAGFENGSTTFPYRSIKRAMDALNRRAGGDIVATSVTTPAASSVPSLKGPIRLSAGSYSEAVSVPKFASGLDASILGSGVATLSWTSGAALTLPPGHRLAIKRPLKITGSPAISGPVATTTVTVDRSRMYVGHGAGVDVTFANTVAEIPEQALYKLLLEGPGVSKDSVKVQTWNGTAWTDRPMADTASGVAALVTNSDAAAVPSFVSGSASVRVVASSTMGITITGQLVGAMTEVVYASQTLPYIEVAEVPDAPVPPVGTPRTDADDAPPTVRLSGEDRAATAAAVSRSAFPDGADAVFVATGASYADALAGGPAAAKSGSPVVLVERDTIPEATRTELQRLAPDQMRLLGGTGAISAEVEQELAAMGAEVSRLRGDSRYATAAAVSAAHFAPGVPVVYIASGEGFADALSGGAAAAALGAPVLLVQPDAVPAATDEELRRLAPGRMVILGGRQAVSESVEAQLRAHGSDVRRVSGATRYATSAAVSRDAFAGTHETVFVATGATFPDALAGVPAAGALKAPLMLVETDRLPAEVAAELDRLRPKRIVILGGERSVSQRLERELRSYQIP